MMSMQSIPITEQDTTGSLHDKLAQLGAEMIVKTLQELSTQALVARPQPAEGVTYAEKILKDEAAIDFQQSAVTLARKIRAFNPFPGAHANINGNLVKFWNAQALDTSSQATAGQVISANAQDGVLIACGEGVLRVTELQKPGGKRLPAADFLKGFPLEPGSTFNLVAK